MLRRSSKRFLSSSMPALLIGSLLWSGSAVLAEDSASGGLASGVILKNIDKSVSPADDFFRHVNGKWLRDTDIPADQSSYGSFNELDIQTQQNIRTIIEEASKESNPSPIAKQVGDFYRSYTNVEQRNQQGIKPIQGLLDQVKKLNDKPEVMQLAGEFARKGIPTFFGFDIDVDARRSDQYAVYLGQGGITLPDRDFYLEDNEKFQKILAKYREYIIDMLTQIEWPDPTTSADAIIELERELARAQWTNVELRDPIKTYNKMPSAEFSTSYKNLDWSRYSTGAGLPSALDLIVGQPSFFSGASQSVQTVPMNDLKAFLAFKVIDRYALVLTEALEKKHFDFHRTVLTGATEQEPLWRRGVTACNRMLGMPVGQLYVAKHFSPKAKQKMEVMVKNLLKAFEQRLNGLEWMGEGTKKQAREKLAKFTPKIGYPDKWRDYSSVEIVENDVIANLGKIAEFEHAFRVNKLGKPIDRTEWFMPPQIVNAYYNPTMNEIVFPAAILQPPFFNLEADDAVNYGGIGAVIGHEISHGFDDSGCKYDGDGNLRNWWTTSDEEEFDKRSAKLVSQYGAYSPLANQFVNGKLTLGENIGDLGGLNVAYTAYHLSLEGKKPPVLDGYTGDQRFYLGWGQVWCGKYRDQELLNRLLVDPHSPREYRCNGIVSNMDSFYEAFGVKPDSKMYIAPEKRVRIW